MWLRQEQLLNCGDTITTLKNSTLPLTCGGPGWSTQPPKFKIKLQPTRNNKILGHADLVRVVVHHGSRHACVRIAEKLLEPSFTPHAFHLIPLPRHLFLCQQLAEMARIRGTEMEPKQRKVGEFNATSSRLWSWNCLCFGNKRTGFFHRSRCRLGFWHRLTDISLMGTSSSSSLSSSLVPHIPHAKHSVNPKFNSNEENYQN